MNLTGKIRKFSDIYIYPTKSEIDTKKEEIDPKPKKYGGKPILTQKNMKWTLKYMKKYETDPKKYGKKHEFDQFHIFCIFFRVNFILFGGQP